MLTEEQRQNIIEQYKDIFPKCGYVLSNEQGQKLLDNYLQQFYQYLGKKAFYLYSTKGIPLSITLERFEKNWEILFLQFLDEFILK
jgi:hypothetical protein